MADKNLTRLVKKASKGDVAAFREIYELKWKEVHFIAYKMTSNFDTAQDIAQEVFIKLYKNIQTLSNPKAFQSWLYQIVRTTCIDVGKLKANKVNDHLEDIEEYAGHIQEDRAEFLPEDALSRTENREMLRRIVEELNENYRFVILMFYYEQMSCDEIAKTLNLSVSAVKVRLQRARTIIRKRYEAEQDKGGEAKHMGVVPILSVLFQEEANVAITEAMKTATFEKVATELALEEALAVAAAAGAAKASAAGMSTLAKTAIISMVSVTVVGSAVTAVYLTQDRGDDMSLESSVSSSVVSSLSQEESSQSSLPASSSSEETASSSVVSESESVDSSESLSEIIYGDDTLEGILGYDNAVQFRTYMQTLHYGDYTVFEGFAAECGMENPVTYFFPVGDGTVTVQYDVYTKVKGNYKLYVCEKVNVADGTYELVYRIAEKEVELGEPDQWA